VSLIDGIVEVEGLLYDQKDIKEVDKIVAVVIDGIVEMLDDLIGQENMMVGVVVVDDVSYYSASHHVAFLVEELDQTDLDDHIAGHQ